jgi:PAS domain S-box-containing protein
MTKEFKPNGGSSMKDATNTILRRLDEIEGSVAIGIQMDRLLASAPKNSAVFQADKDGQLEWVSPRWLELTGLTLEEACGTGWINAVAHAEQEEVETAWQAAKEAQRSWIMDFSVVNVDTSETHRVHCVSTPAMSGRGKVAGWVGTCIPTNLPPNLPVLT